MDELVFDQRRSPDTLANSLRLLLAEWLTLSAPTRQRLEERRRQLRRELPTTAPLQRVGKVIDFLQELEADIELQPILGATLRNGKGPRYRMLVQLSDEELRGLVEVLSAPSPEAPQTATSGEQLPFQLQLAVAEPATAGAPRPVIVSLSQDTRPPAQRFDSILVPFADLRQPVLLEVKLIAQGFREATGDWTRTIQVSSFGPSLPAVFLLEGGQPTGEQALLVQFAQVVGSGLRTIAISAPLQAKAIAPYDPSRGPLRGMTTEQQVDFFTDVRFPSQVSRGTVQPLIVRLTLEQAASSLSHERMSVTFADPNRTEVLEVVLTATGFSERTANPRRTLLLYSRADSQPAVFLLEAGEAMGGQTLALDFYHKGRLLHRTAFSVEIVDKVVGDSPLVRLPADLAPIEPLPAAPPPPPDLTLSIVYDRLRKTLQFRLHAESLEVGYRDRLMGQVELTADPSEVMAELFLNLSTLAATPVASASAEEQAAQLAELETIGEDLFTRLFPPDLQQEYWRIKRLREQGLVRTLLIISDEPWIPWELVKPFQFDQASGQANKDGFLAAEFHLARWLAHRGVAPVTEIRAARLVAPQSNLAYTEKERSFFAELGQQGIEVGEPLGTRNKVLETFGAAKVKLVHVAAHGAFQMQSPNNAPLELDNNEYLRPADLAGSRALAARRERPLVFLNACQVGQVAFYLTGLGGWAERMVADIGVSAFVGALWEINDQLAAEFAIFFYRQLMAGMSLAAAFHAARLHIRGQAPGNPTWLAYTLYADPNARVNWAGNSSR